MSHFHAWMIRWGLFVSPFEWCSVMQAFYDDYVAEAQSFLDLGLFSQASRLAESAVIGDPDRAAAWVVLGRARLRSGELRGAIAALEHASLLAPLTDDVRLDLALAYGDAGKSELSRDLLMELAVSGRMNAAQLMHIAAGLEVAGQLALAMEACRRAGRAAPDSPVIHYQMAYYAALCGHPTSVSEALIRHAIQLDPGNVHYRIGLASLLIRSGRADEAVTTLDRFIPERLSEVGCHCCLKRIANLYFDAGNLALAAQCARRCAEIRPISQHPQAHTPSQFMDDPE